MEKYIKRTITISKCEECTIQYCAYRVLCGAIPDGCPLPKDKKSFVDYHLQHQSRNYKEESK